jgi:phage terminase large subunit
MHSVGKFLTLFRKLSLQDHQIGGDEGYGHQLMDRMQEEGFYLKRFNNGSTAKRSDIYVNLAVEWWSEFGQRVERRQIIIPNDEKLVAQLTSRRKLYDSKGREKLESKADMRSRGIESPDRADALIGAAAILVTGKGQTTNNVDRRAHIGVDTATVRHFHVEVTAHRGRCPA